MQQKKQSSLSYFILFLVTSNFYINRILSRFIFQSAGKIGWVAMSITAVLMIPIGFIIYFLAKPRSLKKWKKCFQSSLPVRFCLNLSMLASTFLCLVFTMTLTNASWLEKTPYFLFVLPFFVIVYYVVKNGMPTFLNLATLCAYPIAIQYLIFVFAKHKTFDFYALIPFSGQSITQPFILIIAVVAMLCEPFLLLFYMDEDFATTKKRPYVFTFSVLILTLIYDAIIVTGQFGTLVSKIPFVYYESWRAINFGQYIVYLDIFAFFYWITSAFCRVSLGFFVWQKCCNHASSLASLFFLGGMYLALIYTLNHVDIYASIRLALLVISTLGLLFAVLLNGIEVLRRRIK